MARGLNLWALVSSATDQKIILLARSVGIEQFTFMRDEAAKDVRSEAAQFIAQLEGLTGHELRCRFLGLNVNGLPIGDLLYDTSLRETRQVTRHEVDDDLRADVALMPNYYALSDRLLQDEEVGAVWSICGLVFWLSQSMGLGSDRPNGLLILRAVPDANHFSHGVLFDDFSDWYRQTLEAVRDQPEIDWLVKLRPNSLPITTTIWSQRREPMRSRVMWRIFMCSLKV
ncbi:MAG: hypothetical protein CMM69_07300 [Rhodospirillaceae bacterium]|nr:hypothetical protein [Rhodospirillaceae bacterium]OUX27965.1 MAG: hypothetical protein CBE16_07745 [Rhodospirillaceae bacterium TMED256]